jgi:uncharacterized protein (TIGR03435 family)
MNTLIVMLMLGGLTCAQGLKDFVLEPGASGGHFSLSDEKVEADGIALRELVAFAWSMPAARVIGAGWLDDRYRVSAQAGAGETGHFREALQRALAERLGLRAERATEELAVYVLKVADPGALKAHQSNDGLPERTETTNTSINAVNLPIARFENLLSRLLERPVVHEAGLEGRLTVRFDVSDASAKTIAQALRRHLGLELSEGRRAVEVLNVTR